MAIIRLYAGADGRSHFEEVTPRTREVGPEPRVSVFVPLG
jgi:hypothetical protein